MMADRMDTLFYGDGLRWFMGVVVSTDDPLRMGRCRVRIFGIHNEDVDEVPEALLPWASCVVPTTEDGVSGLGRSPQLKPGAEVFGIFGDYTQSQQPIIIGSIPHTEIPTEQQLGLESNNRLGEAETVQTVNREAVDNAVVQALDNSPSGGSIADADTLVGTSNTEKAYNFFIANGYSPIQAAAICGNLIVESGMDPTIISGVPGENSYGIAQWNPAAGRLQTLQSYATDNNLDYTKLQTQLMFLHWEFSTESPRFYRYATFKRMTNLENATRHFTVNYERPSIPHHARRLTEARAVLETYNVD
jgi:hypothetical protein